MNFAKTKEIVFTRPTLPRDVLPPPFNDIERVTFCKLLGVTIQSDLRFNMYVNQLITSCTQRLFLLRALKARGLDAKNLSNVYKAIVVGRINYALSVWGGYISAVDKSRINKLFAKCCRYGYINVPDVFDDLLHDSDASLFKKIQREGHPLFHLLPPRTTLNMKTRPKGHNFYLPQIKYDLRKKSFLIRALFKFKIDLSTLR